jgi:hypothetical protein
MGVRMNVLLNAPVAVIAPTVTMISTGVSTWMRWSEALCSCWNVTNVATAISTTDAGRKCSGRGDFRNARKMPANIVTHRVAMVSRTRRVSRRVPASAADASVAARRPKPWKPLVRGTVVLVTTLSGPPTWDFSAGRSVP